MGGAPHILSFSNPPVSICCVQLVIENSNEHITPLFFYCKLRGEHITGQMLCCYKENFCMYLPHVPSICTWRKSFCFCLIRVNVCDHWGTHWQLSAFLHSRWLENGKKAFSTASESVSHYLIS